MGENRGDLREGRGPTPCFAVLLCALVSSYVAQNENRMVSIPFSSGLLEEFAAANSQPTLARACLYAELRLRFTDGCRLVRDFQVDAASSRDLLQSCSGPFDSISLVKFEQSLALRINHRQLSVAADNQHSARHRVHYLLQFRAHTLVLRKARLQGLIPLRQLKAQVGHLRLQCAVGVLEARRNHDEFSEFTRKKCGAFCLHP